MRKLFLLTSFLVITPVFLFLNIFFLLTLTKQKQQILSHKTLPSQPVAYAALPTIQNVFWDEIIQKDIRIENVRQFFVRYNSPLTPFAENVVLSADIHKLDYRLIPAIAMQESNLCKKAPPKSYNCWGFGIYGKKVKKFTNYSQAIDTITKTLAKYYKGKGLETPEEIMTVYTPSNTGSWAKSVSYFMNQL